MCLAGFSFLRTRIGSIALAAILLLASDVLLAQRAAKLAPGMFLLAPRKAADSSFAETVILLVRVDETGSMGLVINRPTTLAINSVFHDIPAARKITEKCYAGGPVQPDTALALYRSAQKEKDASAIFGNVYLVSTITALTRIFNTKPEAGNFHAYLGYTGWGPGQLEHEMNAEVWRVLPADAESVFSSDPSAVWPSLIKQTELQLALLHSPVHRKAQ